MYPILPIGLRMRGRWKGRRGIELESNSFFRVPPRSYRVFFYRIFPWICFFSVAASWSTWVTAGGESQETNAGRRLLSTFFSFFYLFCSNNPASVLLRSHFLAFSLFRWWARPTPHACKFSSAFLLCTEWVSFNHVLCACQTITARCFRF